jgi:hypothetical protein
LKAANTVTFHYFNISATDGIDSLIASNVVSILKVNSYPTFDASNTIFEVEEVSSHLEKFFFGFNSRLNLISKKKGNDAWFTY